MDIESKKDNAPPASWGMIIIAIVIGMVVGFVGRPWLMPATSIIVEKVVTKDVVITATASEVIAEVPSPTAEEKEEATESPQPEATVPLPTPSVMDLVMVNTRHVLGEETAPVTIVEFSDFK